MELDPASRPLRERYGLLISVIQPRPIAWVSTLDGEGRRNLAPFSFFTGITAAPMTICFCPSNTRDGKKKDSLLNIEETRQFVVNVATESAAVQMVATSAEYPRGVDEFEKAGLTPVPSVKVRPPRVAESPVALECELDRVIEVSAGPAGGNLVLGRVVHVHVDDAVWKDGRLSHRDLKPVGRLEGAWYSKVTDDFEIPRPR